MPCSSLPDMQWLLVEFLSYWKITPHQTHTHTHTHTQVCWLPEPCHLSRPAVMLNRDLPFLTPTSAVCHGLVPSVQAEASQGHALPRWSLWPPFLNWLGPSTFYVCGWRAHRCRLSSPGGPCQSCTRPWDWLCDSCPVNHTVFVLCGASVLMKGGRGQA